MQRALPCLLGLALHAAGCGPIWYLDAEFGQRLAKQENKPLLLYFKAWDSTAHRNMRLVVFQHPEVKREMMNTINVELEHAWATNESRQYRVPTAQVCLLCDPDGAEVSRIFVNPLPSEQKFLDWLRQAKSAAVPPAATRPASTQPSRAPG